MISKRANIRGGNKVEVQIDSLASKFESHPPGIFLHPPKNKL